MEVGITGVARKSGDGGRAPDGPPETRLTKAMEQGSALAEPPEPPNPDRRLASVGRATPLWFLTAPNGPGILPGFWPAFSYTLLYLTLIVLLPLSAVFLKSISSSWSHLWKTVTSPNVLAAYRLSFGASFAAGLASLAIGFLVAWVLVRYPFPGRGLADALVDLPFALPTAVAGIALTSLYTEGGWVGRYFAALGIKVAFTPLGIIIALTFIGIPFVVRSVQPVLADADRELEDAAASLGATRWQAFTHVIFPQIRPALLTGFALAFARALGEYGSVIFISGNMPMKTEIAPLLIVNKLEQYDYSGATAIAVVMLVASFLLLLGINALQRRTRRFMESE